MAEIKPAEVSAILRQQLAGFKSEEELEEVGTVLQVGDGIARIYGLSGVKSGELIEFENGLFFWHEQFSAGDGFVRGGGQRVGRSGGV